MLKRATARHIKLSLTNHAPGKQVYPTNKSQLKVAENARAIKKTPHTNPETEVSVGRR
jgi:hypothetical protein